MIKESNYIQSSITIYKYVFGFLTQPRGIEGQKGRYMHGILSCASRLTRAWFLHPSSFLLFNGKTNQQLSTSHKTNQSQILVNML